MCTNNNKSITINYLKLQRLCYYYIFLFSSKIQILDANHDNVGFFLMVIDTNSCCELFLLIKKVKLSVFGYKYPKLDRVWVLKICHFGFWVGI